LAVRLGRQGPTHRELAQASGRSIQAVSAEESNPTPPAQADARSDLAGRRGGAPPSAEIDRVTSYLTKLEVREDLQLPWLAGQHGYRIVDGRLIPAGDR
jgi:hypothetical protein